MLLIYASYVGISRLQPREHGKPITKYTPTQSNVRSVSNTEYGSNQCQTMYGSCQIRYMAASNVRHCTVHVKLCCGHVTYITKGTELISDVYSTHLYTRNHDKKYLNKNNNREPELTSHQHDGAFQVQVPSTTKHRLKNTASLKCGSVTEL